MPKENINVTEAIRAFNRYYTHKIGLLNNHLYGTQFSLTEARIIFHVGENDGVTASKMASLFGLDPGYTSRVIKKIVQADILKKEKSKKDTRIHYLSLTAKGKKVLANLVMISNRFIEDLLQPLANPERVQILEAMERIKNLLEKNIDKTDIYTIRNMRPGDLGYLVSSHMILYGKEYHFDNTFEYYVGNDVMAFGRDFDPEKENLWIAENRFQRVGTIAIVNNGKGVAQLRWLLVEASARGHGIGEKLVDTAVSFAREKLYEKIVLMTTDFLKPARLLYEKFGFKRTSSQEEVKWGKKMRIEYLELLL
ncbi:MAG: MarR family transcriptional regulator [Deltaproteobacteria bacterium]|nr:MarR family transcriptional regulator [Deltaproteobacteria bacterium]